MHWLEVLGSRTIFFVEEMGKVAALLIQSFRWTLYPPLGLKNILKQMNGKLITQCYGYHHRNKYRKKTCSEFFCNDPQKQKIERYPCILVGYSKHQYIKKIIMLSVEPKE